MMLKRLLMDESNFVLKQDLDKYLDLDEIPAPFVVDSSFDFDWSWRNKAALWRDYLFDTVVGRPFRVITNRRVYHEVLRRHLTQAWDLDGTLINGPRSWFWRRWIRDNHQYHKFWILTFRRPQDTITIWDELHNCRDPLNPEWFEGIRNIEPVLWSAWVELHGGLQDLDHETKITSTHESIIRSRNLNANRIISINRAMRAWKATECKKLRCTVLIEDRETFCKSYCQGLGIEFINSITGWHSK